MKQCPWEKINDFRRYSEFDQFVEWINDQVTSNLAKELPVKNRYIGSTIFQEKWFLHISSGQVWRVVWPDFPFTGVFEPIEKNDQ